MTPLYVVALLIVLLLVWKVFGKRLLAAFLLQKVGQGALKAIGSEAVSKQPDWIKLNKVVFPQWKNAEDVQAMVRPLVALGFEEVGIFTPDKMPGVLLKILVKPDDCVAVHVYEHPQAGSWIELVTRYEDGSSTTLTTMKATGMDRPSWLTTIRSEKLPSDELCRQLIKNRKQGKMVPATPDGAVREFEEGYAKYMLWRKNTAIKPEEVAQIVKDWAKRKEGESFKAEAGK